MAVRLTLDHIGGHHTFDSREHRLVKIGRLGRAHVQLSDPSVSRMHASIELYSRGAAIVDLGTLGGTQVDGERVRGKHTLHHNDVVRVGGTELRVHLQPVIVNPVEVPGRRRAPSTPLALPAPEPMPDQTVPCRRGVGRNWLALDYVTTEKYDTRFLVARMKEVRQRTRALAVLAVIVAAAAIAALPVAAPEVNLPEVEVAKMFTPPLPAPEPEPPIATHVVEPGDTLGTIAAEQLGDAANWRQIWLANRDRLDNPSALDIGMVLVMPER